MTGVYCLINKILTQHKCIDIIIIIIIIVIIINI